MTDIQPTFPYGAVSLNQSEYTNLWLPLPPAINADGTEEAMTVSEAVDWLARQVGGDDEDVNRVKRSIRDAVLHVQPLSGSPPRQNGGSRPAQPRSAPPSRAEPTGLFCPEHRVEVEKTPAQYDADGDRYQHLYPAGETGPQGGKRHALYLRELVDAQGNPAGASGTSTAERPPWQGGSAQPVVTRADDPLPAEPLPLEEPISDLPF